MIALSFLILSLFYSAFHALPVMNHNDSAYGIFTWIIFNCSILSYNMKRTFP